MMSLLRCEPLFPVPTLACPRCWLLVSEGLTDLPVLISVGVGNGCLVYGLTSPVQLWSGAAEPSWLQTASVIKEEEWGGEREGREKRRKGKGEREGKGRRKCDIVSTLVHSCSLLYTLVYSCILLYILVYSCILLYILVHICYTVQYIKYSAHCRPSARMTCGCLLRMLPQWRHHSSSSSHPVLSVPAPIPLGSSFSEESLGGTE